MLPPGGAAVKHRWPSPAGPTDQRRDQVIYYQYRSDRARRTLRGIDEQVAKAERAVAGALNSCRIEVAAHVRGGIRTRP